MITHTHINHMNILPARYSVDSKTSMASSSIRFILLLLSANVVPSHGGISWGQFLGAGWSDAEGE